MNVIKQCMSCISLIFLVSACAPPLEDVATYEKLCEIYESIVQQPIDYSHKLGKLVGVISEELPEFYDKYFVHIEVMERSRAYELTKQMIEMNIKREWECAAMKAYYDGDYDSPISE